MEVGKGVEYCTLQTTLLLLHAPGSQAGSTSALAGSVGAIAAVNGSYFNVKTREPVTYLKTDGRQVAPTTVREAGVDTDGILAISKWGRVSIFPGDTASCNRLCKKYKDAIASGPILLQDGQPVRDNWPETGFFTSTIPGRSRIHLSRTKEPPKVKMTGEIRCKSVHHSRLWL